MTDSTQETLSQRLQNSASYAVPVYTTAAAFGTILSYHQPEMPMAVIFAYTTLFAVALNLAYGAARFFGARIVK